MTSGTESQNPRPATGPDPAPLPTDSRRIVPSPVVAVVATEPDTVLDDVGRAMALAGVWLSICMTPQHWELWSSCMRQCMNAAVELHRQQHPRGYCYAVATP